MADVIATAPLSVVDCRFRGSTLAEHILRYSINVIGEPTTALFRKRDVDDDMDNIFRVGANDYICLADLSLWLRLLTKGDAVYLAEELSCFRIHPGQQQRKPDIALRCLTERYQLVLDAHAMGFLHDPGALEAALTAVGRMYEAALSDARLAPTSRARLAKLQERILDRLNSAGNARG